MEQQHDNRGMTDDELNTLLKQWKAPPAPAHLRSVIFPNSRGPIWHKFWTGSIRVPVPVAAGLVLLLVFAAWHWISSPTHARVPVVAGIESMRTA